MDISQVKTSCNDCHSVGRPTIMFGPLGLTPPKSVNEGQVLASGELALRMIQHSQNASDARTGGPSHTQFSITDENDQPLCMVVVSSEGKKAVAVLDPSAVELGENLKIEAEGKPASYEKM